MIVLILGEEGTLRLKCAREKCYKKKLSSLWKKKRENARRNDINRSPSRSNSIWVAITRKEGNERDFLTELNNEFAKWQKRRRETVSVETVKKVDCLVTTLEQTHCSLFFAHVAMPKLIRPIVAVKAWVQQRRRENTNWLRWTGWIEARESEKQENALIVSLNVSTYEQKKERRTSIASIIPLSVFLCVFLIFTLDRE